MLLLSAQALIVPPIALVTFTSEDRVRDVIHEFDAGGLALRFDATDRVRARHATAG